MKQSPKSEESPKPNKNKVATIALGLSMLNVVPAAAIEPTEEISQGGPTVEQPLEELAQAPQVEPEEIVVQSEHTVQPYDQDNPNNTTPTFDGAYPDQFVRGGDINEDEIYPEYNGPVEIIDALHPNEGDQPVIASESADITLELISNKPVTNESQQNLPNPKDSVIIVNSETGQLSSLASKGAIAGIEAGSK